MSIYIEVTNGKYAASTVSLEDGDVAGVGRGVQADVFCRMNLKSVTFLSYGKIMLEVKQDGSYD